MKSLTTLLIISIILSLTGSGFCLAEENTPATLLISKIQISGGTGLTNQDFVKIYNPNNEAVNLQGYRLVKRTATGANDTNIKSWTNETIIEPHSYHVWANSKDDFATSINASSSTAQTIANDNSLALRFGAEDTGQIIDSLSWGDCLNDFTEGALFPTNPEANQILTRINNLDTDNNATDFTIPIDNEETNPPNNSNNNVVVLTPTTASNSGGNISSITKEVITNNVIVIPPPPEIKIYISEILPDPVGIDMDYSCYSCGEFIELYNAGTEIIDLRDWQIQVDNQRPFIINHFLPLAPQTYFAFYRAKTGLILNNRQGEIKLYQPDSKLAERTVKYKNALENNSYNLENNLIDWQWSKIITPQQVNNINYAPLAEFYFSDNLPYTEEVIFDASDSYDLDNELLNFTWDFGDGQTSSQTNPTHGYSYPGDYNVVLKISDGLNKTTKKSAIKIAGQVTLLPEAVKIYGQPTIDPPIINNDTKNTAASNNLITARGVVVAPPNTYGSQYFYILPMRADETVEGQALQIYSYYKTFPLLAIGDYIEVQGEISETSDDSRLKIKDIDAIQILDHDYIIVEREIKTDQINSRLRGQLVAVNGQVVDKQGQNIFLKDEVGQAIIYLSTGSNLSASDLSIGQTYRIIGLVRQVNGQFKIMPRSTQDIVANVTQPVIDEVQPEILGEKITTTPANMVLPAKNEQQKILEYLLITAAIIIIALVIYIFRTNKKTS